MDPTFDHIPHAYNWCQEWAFYTEYESVTTVTKVNQLIHKLKKFPVQESAASKTKPSSTDPRAVWCSSKKKKKLTAVINQHVFRCYKCNHTKMSQPLIS